MLRLITGALPGFCRAFEPDLPALFAGAFPEVVGCGLDVAALLLLVRFLDGGKTFLGEVAFEDFFALPLSTFTSTDAAAFPVSQLSVLTTFAFGIDVFSSGKRLFEDAALVDGWLSLSGSFEGLIQFKALFFCSTGVVYRSVWRVGRGRSLPLYSFIFFFSVFSLATALVRDEFCDEYSERPPDLFSRLLDM